MSIVATWYACRQNIEFWKQSELGLTCASFSSQLIEYATWYYKSLHFHHGSGTYNQIPYICKLATGGNEGAVEQDIPNYSKMAEQQQKQDRYIWDPDHSDGENALIAQSMSPLFRYFLGLIENIQIGVPVNQRIQTILKLGKYKRLNRKLKRWLRSLGERHSDVRSQNLIRDDGSLALIRNVNDDGKENDDDVSVSTGVSSNNDNNNNNNNNNNNDDNHHDNHHDNHSLENDYDDLNDFEEARNDYSDVEVMTGAHFSKKERWNLINVGQAPIGEDSDDEDGDYDSE